jgi:hypothetical protein
MIPLRPLLHRLTAVFALGLAGSGAALAAPLEGDRTVWLSAPDGERTRIASVHFEPLEGGSARFELRLDGAGFSDYFLAMRPVRCLTGPREQLCHFPYGTRTEVSLTDLSALEYQLLFMHKKAATVSLDPRDGIYWILHVDGDRLVGVLQDADLDPIVAPQGDADHPLTKEHLQPADEASHWLPRLTIE